MVVFFEEFEYRAGFVVSDVVHHKQEFFSWVFFEESFEEEVERDCV